MNTNTTNPNTSNACTIHMLPPEVLERVLEHAVGTRTSAGGCLRERQWISASDLIQAQPLGLVCTAWRDSLRAIVRRFTFFSLPSHPKSSYYYRNSSCAYTCTDLLRPLSLLPNLGALQLFLRPQEASVFADALEKFLVLRTSKVHTVHICMPPTPARSRNSSAVNLITTAIARGTSTNLNVLSLDSCGSLSPHLFRDNISRNTPNLSTLALDSTYMPDWNELSILSDNLVELSLRNCNLNDDDLRIISSAVPNLDTLALGYSGIDLSHVGISHLAANCTALRSIELARCAGIRDRGTLELVHITSLTTIALLHIDVTASTLVSLVKTMGKRLSALCVTSVRTTTTAPAYNNSINNDPVTVETVMKTARMHCPNLSALEFSQRRSPHWSERAYAEQYRFVANDNSSNNNNMLHHYSPLHNGNEHAHNNYNIFNNNSNSSYNNNSNNAINHTLLFKHYRRRRRKRGSPATTTTTTTPGSNNNNNVRLHRFFKSLLPNKRRSDRSHQQQTSLPR